MKTTVEWIKTGKRETMQERYARVLVNSGLCKQLDGVDAPPAKEDRPLRRTRGKYQRRDMTAETVETPIVTPAPAPVPVVEPAPVVIPDPEPTISDED